MAKKKGSSTKFPPDYFVKDDVVAVAPLTAKAKAFKDAFEKVFPKPCAKTDKSVEARIPIPLSAKGKDFRGYKMGGVKKYNELHKALMSILSGLGELSTLTNTMGQMPAPKAPVKAAGKRGAKQKRKRQC